MIDKNLGLQRGSSRYGTVKNSDPIYKSKEALEHLLAMAKEDLAVYEKEGKTREIGLTKKDIKEMEADLSAGNWRK